MVPGLSRHDAELKIDIAEGGDPEFDLDVGTR